MEIPNQNTTRNKIKCKTKKLPRFKNSLKNHSEIVETETKSQPIATIYMTAYYHLSVLPIKMGM